jgi:hypothetical protein
MPAALLAMLLLSLTVFIGQADRGTITGVVNDSEWRPQCQGRP